MKSGIVELVCKSMDDDREIIIDLVCRLIDARSDNPPGNVSGPAQIVSSFLAGRGIEVETFARKPEKPNLVSRLRGRSEGRHLVLNGHLDTIGAGAEDDWSVPVYRATRKDGRIYGLGAGNMKGSVAALTAAYAFLARHRQRIYGTLTYTAVADETVFGPDGAGFLLEQRPDLVGDAVICGEGPGGMNLAIAEKGLLWLALEARVPSGQGMLSHRQTSAIAKVARAIETVDGWNDEHIVPPPDLAGLVANAGAHGLRLSVNAGTVHGGRFVSQVADSCIAEIDFRLPPGVTIAEIEKRVAALCGDGMSFRRIKGWDPNWTAPEAVIVRTVGETAKAVRGPASAEVVRLPASDASRWRALGIPAVCFGAQPDLASGIDDYVNESDVIDCAKIYALAALAYLGEANS